MSALDNGEFWYKVMKKSRDTPSALLFVRPLKFTVDNQEKELRVAVVESTEYGLQGGLATRHFYYISYAIEGVFTLHLEITHIKSLDSYHDSGLGRIALGSKDHSFTILSKELMVNSYSDEDTADHYLTMFVLAHSS